MLQVQVIRIAAKKIHIFYWGGFGDYSMAGIGLEGLPPCRLIFQIEIKWFFIIRNNILFYWSLMDEWADEGTDGWTDGWIRATLQKMRGAEIVCAIQIVSHISSCPRNGFALHISSHILKIA